MKKAICISIVLFGIFAGCNSSKGMCVHKCIRDMLREIQRGPYNTEKISAETLEKIQSICEQNMEGTTCYGL